VTKCMVHHGGTEDTEKIKTYEGIAVDLAAALDGARIYYAVEAFDSAMLVLARVLRRWVIGRVEAQQQQPDEVILGLSSRTSSGSTRRWRRSGRRWGRTRCRQWTG